MLTLPNLILDRVHPRVSSIQVSGTSDRSEGTIECFYRTRLLQLRDRSDSGAGRQSHALCGCAAHEAIEHLELHRIDCLSSNGQLDSYEYSREQLRSLPPEAIPPTPLITGRDLIEAGYEPGPRFKEMLAAAEDAQLEGRLTSREAALEFVGREFQA